MTEAYSGSVNWCFGFSVMGFTVPDLVFWVFTISDLVFWILSSGFYRSGFGVPAFRILLYFTSCPKWQKNSVCCTPYLRKHTSYDCDFWWFFMISPGVFFHIFKYWFSWLLGGEGGRGKRVKKWPKMTKNSVHLTLCLRNCTSNYRQIVVIFGTHL